MAVENIFPCKIEYSSCEANVNLMSAFSKELLWTRLAVVESAHFQERITKEALMNIEASMQEMQHDEHMYIVFVRLICMCV